jgi:RNA polymerase sigma factor (sigma-70 family)
VTLTDEEARTTSKMLRGYFRNRSLPVDCVDDAVQDVLTSILAGPGGIRCLSAYAIAAARNHNAAVWRQVVQQRERHCDLTGADSVAAADNPLRDLEAAERRQTAESFLAARLPARHRELLSRCYLAGESVKEICGAMGITPVQLKNEKHRAKARLAARMGARI